MYDRTYWVEATYSSGLVEKIEHLTYGQLHTLLNKLYKIEDVVMLKNGSHPKDEESTTK